MKKTGENELIQRIKDTVGEGRFKYPSGLSRLELLVKHGHPHTAAVAETIGTILTLNKNIDGLDRMFSRTEISVTNDGWVRNVGEVTRSGIALGLAEDLLIAAEAMQHAEVRMEMMAVLKLNTRPTTKRQQVHSAIGLNPLPTTSTPKPSGGYKTPTP